MQVGTNTTVELSIHYTLPKIHQIKSNLATQKQSAVEVYNNIAWIQHQSVSLGQISHLDGIFISTGNSLPPFAVPLWFNEELSHIVEYSGMTLYSIVMLLSNTYQLMLAIRNIPADTVLLNRIGFTTSTSSSGA